MEKTSRLLFVFLLVLTSWNMMAQEKTITGTVTSLLDDAPLPGVNVIVSADPSRGALTDFDGKYSIEVSEGEQIEFSFLGMKSVTYTVGPNDVINVALDEDAAQLDEVVVTALGISREKKALGYAVTELDSDEINTVKSANVAESLTGKVAGVVVSQSGSLGSGSRIVIRGNNSLTGNNQALIVVDGIPIDASGNESGGGVYSSSVTGGGISDINAEDIESMTVLKGPNAAALYGSRAANGVILITTKKGTTSTGWGIGINSNTMVGNAMFLPDYQNTYGQGTNGAVYPDLEDMGGSSWGPVMDGSSQIYYTGEDKPYSAQANNVEDFFQSSIQTINALTLEKGNEDFTVLFSYTNNYSTSIVPGSELKSNNFNLRATANLTDKLSFDGKATYFDQKLSNRVNLGTEGSLAYVYGMPRNVRTNDLKTYQMENPALYDPAAGVSDYDVISYGGTGSSIGNAYWMQEYDINDERKGRFLGFAKLHYQFNDWLSAFIRAGGDVTNRANDRVSQVGHHFSRYGSLRYGTSRFSEVNTDALIMADLDLTDRLHMNALLGGNLSKRTDERMAVSGSQFKIPTRAFYANTSVQDPSSHQPQQIKKVNSLYAAASFSWDNFLYLDLTGRNDWSSTLGEDNWSYFYPSASVSVLLEKFIDPEHDVLNLLKARASWANVGNDTDPYQINQSYSVASQGYLGLTTVSAGNVKLNPDLLPENVASSEIGIEARFYGNRLYTDMSWYKISTTDMIFDVPVTPSTGYNYFRSNIGKIENTGFEFLVGGIPIQNDNFSWDVSLNFAKNDNKLIELIDGLEAFGLNSTNSGNISIRAEVGGSIGDIYGTVWKTDDDGNRLVNAEGRPIATSDQEHLGNASPDWTGGFMNRFNYKNWTLNFLIDWRVGGQIYSQTSSGLDGSGASARSLEYREDGVVVDAINEGTGVANTERITGQQYWGAYSGIGESYVYDQTNVRLREFALTYNLSTDVARKIGMTNASIALIGRNLFFFSKSADDIDPESMLGTNLGGQGISSNNVPTIRSMGLNINLKF